MESHIFKKNILRKKRKKQRNFILRLLFLICMAFIFWRAYSLCIYIKDKSRKDEIVERGILSIKNLENKDISNIQNKIDKIRQEKTDKKDIGENERSNINKQKSRSYKKIFENTVFMGDSLVEPLEEYNFLSSSSVVAKKGRNVITANEKDLSSVINLKPQKIVMLYGMNDLSIFKNKNDFVNKYKELILNIKKQLPKTEIYINNIFKTQEKVWLRNKDFTPNRITEFNSALNNMCNELKIKYIDVTFLVENDNKLYEPDGIHLIASFYPKWLEQVNRKINIE